MFHSGELAVQKRLGVEALAARVGRGIHPQLAPAAQAFLAELYFVVMGRLQGSRMTIDLYAGERGFLRTPDSRTVRFESPTVLPASPLPTPGQPAGLLAIDLETRRRIRVNGQVVNASDTFVELHTGQVYWNCPKYIQRRRLEPASPEQVADADVYATLDTFFIASSSPEGGVDVSHRGGPAGFVQRENGDICWAEFPGNTMFNTLGNLEHDPRAALLLMDFHGRRLVRVSGRAQVDYTGDLPTVCFRVEDEVQAPMPWRSPDAEASPFNPVLKP